MYSTKNCPSCNHATDIEFDTCPKCGLIIKRYVEKITEREKRDAQLEEERQRKELKEKKRLEEASVTNARTEPQTPLDNLLDCPACKNKVSRNAKNCPNCGEPIASKSSVAGIAIAAVVIIASIGMYYFSKDKTTIATPGKKLAVPVSIEQKQQKVVFIADSIKYNNTQYATVKNKCEALCAEHASAIETFTNIGWRIVASSQKQMPKSIPYPYDDAACSCIGTEYVLEK